MKLNFLHGLLVVFACVIGNGAVLAEEVTCDAAHYLSDGTCVDCPVSGTNAGGKIVTAITPYNLYQFVQGDDPAKCYIKLRTNLLSKCAEGTNVIYTYDANDGKYKYVNDENYVVIPRNGYYRLDGISQTDVVDHCGICDISDGYYKYGDVCRVCPVNENIGYDKRFYFVENAEGQGINSCTVKLNLNKDNCGNDTEVVYKYNQQQGKYIRSQGSNIVATVGFYVASPLPSVDNMSDNFCSGCPVNENIGYDKRFYFVENAEGQGINSCAVKLNLNKDNCGSDTEVVYKYNQQQGKYIRSQGSNIVATVDSYIVTPLPSVDNMSANFCEQCPVNENIGSDKHFIFTRDAIGKCSTKLNVSKDPCNIASDVVYEYNVLQGKYVRTKTNVFPTGSAYVVNPLPATDNMSDNFCFSCSDENPETPYNMGGYCGACTEAGFYLTEDAVCETCPAGYYCPGRTADPNTSQKAIICPENTYSEGGVGECRACPVSYSTVSSGPVDIYDGLCLARDEDDAFGVGCMSSDACKLTQSSALLSVEGKDPFYLSNRIKLESFNKSVVQYLQEIQ